jgi:hypothetical protein
MGCCANDDNDDEFIEVYIERNNTCLRMCNVVFQAQIC